MASIKTKNLFWIKPWRILIFLRWKNSSTSSFSRDELPNYSRTSALVSQKQDDPPLRRFVITYEQRRPADLELRPAGDSRVWAPASITFLQRPHLTGPSIDQPITLRKGKPTLLIPIPFVIHELLQIIFCPLCLCFVSALLCIIITKNVQKALSRQGRKQAMIGEMIAL